MKSKQSKLVAKADRLFSLKIREIGICQSAGFTGKDCGGGLQCAHIVSRRRYNLRWDPMNALSLCRNCHIYWTHSPWKWQEFIRVNFPDRYEYINLHINEFWDKKIDLVLERLKGVIE